MRAVLWLIRVLDLVNSAQKHKKAFSNKELAMLQQLIKQYPRTIQPTQSEQTLPKSLSLIPEPLFKLLNLLFRNHSWSKVIQQVLLVKRLKVYHLLTTEEKILIKQIQDNLLALQLKMELNTAVLRLILPATQAKALI